MTTVTYVEHDGTRHDVDVLGGNTVMRGAVDNDIQGIVGECGGGLACATCHCYVDEAWMDRVGPAPKAESEMLECAASEARPNSRLSCQITVLDDLEGLIVYLPEAQY